MKSLLVWTRSGLVGLSGLLALAGCSHSPDDNAPPSASAIKHLVVIVQENHTFDNYFGRYCTAAVGSNPTCNSGPGCCEAAPDKDPGTGSPPAVLTDEENAEYSPNHNQDCELAGINGGKMDLFVSNPLCGNRRNFAVAPAAAVQPYWQLAQGGALADHFFQSVAGASSSNDMYLARARFVFRDNQFEPDAVGRRCGFNPDTMEYHDPTIGDLLVAHDVPWAFYAEGYKIMADANAANMCPSPPEDCPLGVGIYPCVFDPSDIPFQYYPQFRDNPQYMKDYGSFAQDLQDGALPAVSFVKALGYKTEHPGAGTTISDGSKFVTALVTQILSSQYKDSTLILLAYDEGGGYFDHMPTPPTSPVDNQPYGTRVPLIAIGPFARQNYIAHEVFDHSSIVKFIEWNWLDATTGQLGNRDVAAHNLGSLLDPVRTRVAVPQT